MRDCWGTRDCGTSAGCGTSAACGTSVGCGTSAAHTGDDSSRRGSHGGLWHQRGSRRACPRPCRRHCLTPVGWVISECRMQFHHPCVAPNIRIVGIATFVDAVESSLNRIACETALSERTRANVGPLRPRGEPFEGWEAYPRARGPSNSHANPLMRAWAAAPRRGIAGLRAK